MTELKRPERYVPFESIKPKLSSITNFYTQKVNEYWNRIKQLNEYADALENEISILKGKPKVKVLLDNIGETSSKIVVSNKCYLELRLILDYYKQYNIQNRK